jgi:AraC family transcriptional regulator
MCSRVQDRSIIRTLRLTDAYSDVRFGPQIVRFQPSQASRLRARVWPEGRAQLSNPNVGNSDLLGPTRTQRATGGEAAWDATTVKWSIRMNQSGLVLWPLSRPAKDVPSVRGAAVEFPGLLSDNFEVVSPAPASHVLQVNIERRSAATSSANSGLAAWQMVRVQAYIDKNLHRPILVRQLSAVARRSQAHFSRKFKVAVGEPPHAYVMRRRLQKACHLMMASEASLSEIALNVGFSDQAHLSRHFRESFGRSPSSWRRERRITSEPASTTDGKKTSHAPSARQSP